MASADSTLSRSAAEAETLLPAAKRSRARPYAILALVVGSVLLAYVAFQFFTAGRESTDDAQVGTDMVPISARIGGTVTAVLISDHQAVKRGDLLAQIDPTDYQIRVKEAEAGVVAARAQAESADAQMKIVAASSQGGLSTARAALSGTAFSVAGANAQVEAARAAVARARADAEKADTDLKRAEALRKDDAIPQAQVDSLTAAVAAQRANLAQAEAQLAGATDMKATAQSRIAEARGRVEQSAPVEAQLAGAKANVDLARARVESAEASLAQAQLNLSYTKIVAPEDGHVSKLAVHAGQLVFPSQMVTNVLPIATYVVANFKETQVGEMRQGQSAEISIDAYPRRVFRARVESIGYGTGAQFALLPPDNASGNFVKVVQRVPVKLAWTDLPADVRMEAGLSADVTVVTK